MYPKCIRVPAPSSEPAPCRLPALWTEPVRLVTRLGEVQAEPGFPGVSLSLTQLLCPCTQASPWDTLALTRGQDNPGASRCLVEPADSFPGVTERRTEKPAGSEEPVLSCPSSCLSRKPLEQSPKRSLQPARILLPAARGPAPSDNIQVAVSTTLPSGAWSLQCPLLRCPGLSSGLKSAFHFHPSPLSWE